MLQKLFVLLTAHSTLFKSTITSTDIKMIIFIQLLLPNCTNMAPFMQVLCNLVISISSCTNMVYFVQVLVNLGTCIINLQEKV